MDHRVTQADRQQSRVEQLPVAITVFPGEIYQALRSWAERAYPHLIYYNEVNKGGHFAAWEEPQLFSEELGAAFRPERREAEGVSAPGSG